MAENKVRAGAVRLVGLGPPGSSGILGSEDFNDSTMPRCGTESSVSRQKRCRQGLSKREVGSVVGRSAITKLPDAWQKQVMGVSVQGKVQQVLQRFLTSVHRQLPGPDIAAQDLGNLWVQ